MIHREAKDYCVVSGCDCKQVQPVLQVLFRGGTMPIFFAKSTISHMASSGKVPFSWNALLVEHADDRIQSK
jgi:hypothetical protein